MLAANIDDMTGEAFGYLMERLMAEARWTCPSCR